MSHEVNAFLDAEKHFFSLVSVSQINYENLNVFSTGVYASGLNPAIVSRIDDDLSEILDNIEAYYKERNLPWALVIPDSICSDASEKLLGRKNFILTGKSVAMALSVNEIPLSQGTTSLQIKEMRVDLATWGIPLEHAFGLTPETPGVYMERHREALNRGDLYHFSGFINEIVVCSLTLTVCGQYARIDDVATIPSHQKKGYATELIYAALKHAQQLTISSCFLEASDSGLNLYKRVGFKELFMNHYYEVQ